MAVKALEIQHPPLRNTSDSLLTDTNDKIQLLMRTHVMRENIQYARPPLTMEEVRRAIFKPGNTTPGRP
jgi:hypothetical protein